MTTSSSLIASSTVTMDDADNDTALDDSEAGEPTMAMKRCDEDDMEMPLDPHGSYVPAGNEWPKGSWLLQCDPGYFPAGGVAIALCKYLGQRSPAGVCLPEGCKVLAANTTGIGIRNSTCAKEMSEGEVCTLVCEDGYQPFGGIMCSWGELDGGAVCADRRTVRWNMFLDAFKIVGEFEILFTAPEYLNHTLNETTELEMQQAVLGILVSKPSSFSSLSQLTARLRNTSYEEVWSQEQGIYVVNRTYYLFSVSYKLITFARDDAGSITLTLSDLGMPASTQRAAFTSLLAAKNYTVYDLELTTMPRSFLFALDLTSPSSEFGSRAAGPAELGVLTSAIILAAVGLAAQGE